jgi:TolB protein
MIRKVLLILVLGLGAIVALSYMQHADSGAAQVSSLGSAGPDVGGKIAFAHAGSIWMYEAGKPVQLTRGPEDRNDKRDAQPSFSPDGEQIVYVRFDEGFSDLYKLFVSDPTDPQALTNNRPQAETGSEGYNLEALWTMQPAWSPNGRRIAYTSDVRTEYPGLFSMDTEGDNTRKLDYLDHSIQAVERPSWSPDGSKIAVANYLTRNGKGQIWVLDTETGEWTELTDVKDGAYDPAWSPDGEWIAFTMREGTAHDVYVVPTDATKWTADHPTPIRLTSDGASRSPAWSPDGSRIAYLALKDASFDIYAAQVQFGTDDNPRLANTQRLTDKANIDASSGISWAR